jgi:hypothetical protein
LTSIAIFAVDVSLYETRPTTAQTSQHAGPRRSERRLPDLCRFDGTAAPNLYFICPNLWLRNFGFSGLIHAGFRNEAIVGHAYDFNKTWRVQLDFQSGSGNSSTSGFTCNITRDLQINPPLYVTNDQPHEVLGYVVLTYTFHLWGHHSGD